MDPSDGSLRACKNPKMHPSTNGTETHSFKMVKKSFSGFWCNAKNALYISLRPSRFFSIFPPFVLFSTNLKIADLLYIFKRERERFIFLQKVQGQVCKLTEKVCNSVVVKICLICQCRLAKPNLGWANNDLRHLIWSRTHSGAEYFVFVSSHSLKRRESLSQFVYFLSSEPSIVQSRVLTHDTNQEINFLSKGHST